ncbi:MAG: hypothetical protein ABIG56_05890 [Candidatus Omnitrophota bacterium]
MDRKEIEKKMLKLWKATKRDLDIIAKDGANIIMKSEKYLKEKSEEGKKKLEATALALQKEKLCYELGKAVAKLPNGKRSLSKKANNILSKIREVNKKLRKLK